MESNKFYTQNGWAGSNYDLNLSTKEIAVKVRAFLKKEFPKFRFSVRSEWGIQSDVLRVTVLSGPIPALTKENINTDESSISGFGEAYRGRITDQMLQVCEKINAFVNSFRFSDCDGMQDYFDVNFYCWTYIGNHEHPYQVIEASDAVGSSELAPYGDSGTSQVLNIEIVDYSEKAVAVFGETKRFKEQLSNIGGRFNPSLKYNGGKRAGWVFSKKQADKVCKLIHEAPLPIVE